MRRAVFFPTVFSHSSMIIMPTPMSSSDLDLRNIHNNNKTNNKNVVKANFNIDCAECRRLEVENRLLEDTLGKVQGTLARRVSRLKYLEESLKLFDHRYRHQDKLMRALRDDRERMRFHRDELINHVRKLEVERAELRAELERTPEKPPAPPPPPPPMPPQSILAKILPWKRSKSMSRIDDIRVKQQQNIMKLNEEILDAIRNRRYSLKAVGFSETHPRTRRKTHPDEGIARILQRRIRMEYEEEEESDANGEFA